MNWREIEGRLLAGIDDLIPLATPLVAYGQGAALFLGWTGAHRVARTGADTALADWLAGGSWPRMTGDEARVALDRMEWAADHVQLHLAWHRRLGVTLMPPPEKLLAWLLLSDTAADSACRATAGMVEELRLLRGRRADDADKDLN